MLKRLLVVLLFVLATRRAGSSLREAREIGLPKRFTVGLQNEQKHFAAETRERGFILRGIESN